MVNYTEFVPNYMCSQKLIDRTTRQIKGYRSESGTGVPVIFDVGANVGVYSVCFAELYPYARIFSFEPVPSTFAILKQNTDSHDRIQVFNIGFWSEATKLELGFPEDRTDLENIGLYSIHGTKNKVTVDCQVLDAWCAEHDVYPDFIKIDAEGAEDHIIAGGANCFENHVKYVVCEENKRYRSATRIM